MFSKILEIMLTVWLAGGGFIIGLVAFLFIGKWAAIVLGVWVLSVIIAVVATIFHMMFDVSK